MENRQKNMGLRVGRERSRNVSSHSSFGVRRVNFKAVSGRGRRRTEWVNDLYADTFCEFERVKATGAKVTPSVLRSIALALVDGAGDESSYKNRDSGGGKTLRDKISYRWIQTFMQKMNW